MTLKSPTTIVTLTATTICKLRIMCTRFSFFIRNLSSSSSNSWSLSLKNAPTPQKALQIFTNMHHLSVPLDSFAVLSTLKSCSRLRDLALIRHLHAHILKIGFDSHVYVGTSLLHAYVVTSFSDARMLFDELSDKNTVTWNTMITGYSKAGDLVKARFLFDEMPLRNVPSWSAMIAGYFRSSFWYEGLSLCRDMIVKEGLKPDGITLGTVLSGFAHMGSIGLVLGKSVHCFIVKIESGFDLELGTALVDMYAKCGFFKYACIVFESMREKNVISWTSLICGAAQHGYGKEALSIFQMMQDANISPNEMTFTGILSACAQTGLVEEGRKCFSMIEKYGLEPRIHHYGCIVDMFGKAGMIEDAYETIKTMKLEPNLFIWSSFLSACKAHKQFEIVERVVDQVWRTVRPENDGGVYSLISDLYVLGEKWDEAEKVRKLMATKNVKKVRASSYV